MERELKSNKRGKRLLYIMGDGTGVEVGVDIQHYQNGNLLFRLI